MNTRRILNEVLDAPDRFTYTDLAIAPPKDDEFEQLALYHATSGGEAALARKKLGDAIRERPGAGQGDRGRVTPRRLRRKTRRLTLMLVDGKWTRRLAAGAGDRRQGRLCPPGLRASAAGSRPTAPRARPARPAFAPRRAATISTRRSSARGRRASLIARKLKRLEDVVSVSIVEPAMTDQGWRFGDYPGATRDAVNGATYLHEIYTPRRSAFHRPRDRAGAVGQGARHDRQQRIVRPPAHAQLGLRRARRRAVDLYPPICESAIDALNDEIYPSLNNGVYRAGFADDVGRLRGRFRGRLHHARQAREAARADGRFLFGEG